MSDPLLRGAVVLRHGRFGVVWTVVASWLVLLPVLRPRQRMAYDVELELADLVACAVTMPGAVIRPRLAPAVERDGYAAVGAVPGPTMLRVAHGLARVAAEAAQHDKWAAGERHRQVARAERCVDLTNEPRGAPAPRMARVPFRVDGGRDG